MNASEWNAKALDERVAHLGSQPTAKFEEGVWRGVGSPRNGRLTQISIEGEWRTVDKGALINGGRLKPGRIPMEIDPDTRDVYFPLEGERLWPEQR
jgi:hypothetical protein